MTPGGKQLRSSCDSSVAVSRDAEGRFVWRPVARVLPVIHDHPVSRNTSLTPPKSTAELDLGGYRTWMDSLFRAADTDRRNELLDEWFADLEEHRP